MAAAAELDVRGILVTCPSCGQKNRLTYERLGESVRCGKCKHTLSAPHEPLDMASVADFDRLITLSSLPVVVDYWAPWCGPCRMVAPELVKVADRQAGRLIVAKVNTDVLTELGDRYGIRSIPTLAVFANGQEVSRLAGARPANEIEQFALAAAASVRA